MKLSEKEYLNKIQEMEQDKEKDSAIVQNVMSQIDVALVNKDVDALVKIATEMMTGEGKSAVVRSSKLLCFQELPKQISLEKSAGTETFIDDTNHFEELMHKYDLVNLYLRRIELDIRPGLEAAYEYLNGRPISPYVISGVLYNLTSRIGHRESVLMKLAADSMDGGDLMRAYSLLSVVREPSAETTELKDEISKALMSGKEGALSQRSKKRSVAFFVQKLNDERFAECVFYIKRLQERAQTDVQIIETKTQLSAGAFRKIFDETKADYKVCLDDSVFILNKNFITDCLEIFESDASIAVIGMVGRTKHSESMDVGNFILAEPMQTQLFSGEEIPHNYAEVAEVDESIFAVRGSNDWKLSEGTDKKTQFQAFCDTVKREGKKIVIPAQKTPWILIEQGYMPISEDEIKKHQAVEEQILQTYDMLYLGQRDLIEESVNILTSFYPYNDALVRLSALCAVKKAQEEHPHEEKIIMDWDEVEWAETYSRYRYLFHRLECEIALDGYQEEMRYLCVNPGMRQALMGVMGPGVFVDFETAHRQSETFLASYTPIEIEKPRIAVCVLTHMHPDTVEDVLSHAADVYDDAGIDIYYLDSSTDDKTQKIVEKYAKKHHNLYFAKYQLCSDGKTKYQMWAERTFFKEKYDYIWPVKDRSYCLKETLEAVLFQARKRRDIIMIGSILTERHDLRSKLFTKPTEFYETWGFMTTSIDTILYRADTFLKSLLTTKMWKNKELFDVTGFVHFAYLFSHLANMECPHIKVIKERGMMLLNSKSSQSGWMDQILYIWGTAWVNANDILPDCYNKYKDKVIKVTASLPWLLGNKDRLTELYRQGLISREKFEEVRNIWSRVSFVPIEEVDEILDKNK